MGPIRDHISLERNVVMIAFDLHVHTNFSPCSNMAPMVVLQTAHAAGLNAIAITDHNTTAGAVRGARASQFQPHYVQKLFSFLRG